MAMREQERHSLTPATTRTASDEPPLLGLGGPVTGGSVATMATGDDMAGGGGAGKEKRGPEGAPNKLSVAFQFQRKQRSHVVRRAAPSHRWGSMLGPVLPPAPAKKKARKKKTAKKRDMPCVICGATETPMWRTWPTDWRVVLCNACGIRVREPGAVLPELIYLSPPATATTTVISELERPVEIQPVSNSTRAPLPKQVHVHLPPPTTTATTTTVISAPQEIQASESSPDSLILDSMSDIDLNLLKKTSASPRREKSTVSTPPPPPPLTVEVEPAPAAAAPPAPGNKKDTLEKWCLHCGTTSTLQWRIGPAGESTLCNACGVRYRQGRLVPEYRPRASPTFNQSEHSYKHRDVLKLRKKQDHPAPPAAYKPIRPSRKPKADKAQKNQAGQAQPGSAQAATTQQQRAGNDMVQNLPPPPPALPHAGGDMEMEHRLLFLPPVLAQAGDEIMAEQDLLPPPPPELPHPADDILDPMAAHHLPPPQAQPHAGGELMMDEALPPPDPFLFDGPAAPMIIEDDEPVIVIVIDDD